MKEDWKVYIRGNKDRGKEVIKVLTDLVGGTVTLEGSNTDCIYFIDHDGTIDFEYLTSEQAQIIMDNYKEIKLPVLWKDGDILVDNDDPNRFVVKNNVWNDGNFKAYLYVSLKYVQELPIVTFCDKNYHKADLEEVKRFHELLHKHGKDWNEENKQFIDWKWKPNIGDKYWIITTAGVVGNLIWIDDPADNRLFNLGNYFRTREEAETMLKKIKELLNSKL